jgi:hypothetical protein
MLDRLSSALNMAGNFGVSANGSRIEIYTQQSKGQLLNFNYATKGNENTESALQQSEGKNPKN